jgi:hypothetical protein
MSQELQAFRAADFNWTHDLQSVWSDSASHVDELHGDLIERIIDDFFFRTQKLTDNPIGQVILGEAGAGKTHLIGTLRRRVWQRKGWFVLLDIIGITDFWATTALGFLNSLHQPMPDGRAQYDAVLSAIVRQIPLDAATQKAVADWEAKSDKTRLAQVQLFLQLLRRVDAANTNRHQDVIRALLLLDSNDWDANNLAYCWLQGLDVDESKRQTLGFLKAPPPYPELVRGMLWVMALAGPTLIAVDQIDAIVSASNLLAGVQDVSNDDAERKARAIIDLLAGGLMDLHDLKRRAMTMVSCLQVTWPIIKGRAVQSAAQRFEELPVLEPIKSRTIVENLIGGRLDPAYAARNVRPPYRTWPFSVEALESAVGLLPRQILIRCQEHRQSCIAAGAVFECPSLGEVLTPAPTAPLPNLEQQFQQEIAHADISPLLAMENEDTVASALLIDACELYLKHLNLPDSIDAVVKHDPDRKKPSLHARISFSFHNEGDREQHYCFRLLGHTNPMAFQSRLKAAMTASGIDTALKFRHLFILRRGEPPSGPKTKALVDQFFKAGGRFIAHANDELRIMLALKTMAQRDLTGFDIWLRARQPLFDTVLFKVAGLCPPPFLASGSLGPGPKTPPPSKSAGEQSQANAAPAASVAKPASVDAGVATPPAATEPSPGSAPQPESSADRRLPIGHRFERGRLGEPVMLAADLLPRHVAILAGSGSGKTVLLRRIVEEAALLGIPAIVLDINNDLSRLGDSWPTPQDGLSDEDAAKASLYLARTQVTIWTPGVSSGNPLSLKLLPDFAAIGEAADRGPFPRAGEGRAGGENERAEAVEMARATLAPLVGGSGQKAALKQGVLADALRAFAQGSGGQLDELIEFLSELPDDVSKIGDAPKLAAEMANQLLAAIATNPLLQSSGATVDPQRLFNDRDGKTTISVINLAGLGSDEARQAFVNQLQMALFTWIKQHPSPTGRLYVIDEAQNFAPSQAATASKASARSLVAQARKYGLGMIFATQLPRGIDNAIISNCTTHVYGRMSSPATIQATQELMAAKGGSADDIARLSKGEFYFSTEGFNRPIKIRTPLCLSWHPPNPPTADEVNAKARKRPKS